MQSSSDSNPQMEPVDGSSFAGSVLTAPDHVSERWAPGRHRAQPWLRSKGMDERGASQIPASPEPVIEACCAHASDAEDVAELVSVTTQALAVLNEHVFCGAELESGVGGRA